MPGSCWQCVTVSSTSSPFCPGPCCGVLRQRHRGHLSAQGGGHQVSCFQHHCAGDPPLGGISSDSAGSPVCSGDPQCSRARTLSPVLISSPAPSGLNMDVFRSLSRQWPVMIDLFATSDNHRCSIYFSPFRDPLSAGTDARLQSWDGLLTYAFLPWSILLRVSHRTLLTLVAPFWPQRPWFVDLLQWLFPLGQTSSSCHGLVGATRVSTGWPFMPGDYPAIHQSSWFLLGGSGASFVGAPSILTLQLPAEVVGLPVLVPLAGSLHLAADPLQGGGFPLMAPLCLRS